MEAQDRKPVVWIEDEIDRLGRAVNRLSRELHIEYLKSVSDVLRYLDRGSGRHAVWVVDLFLPLGDPGLCPVSVKSLDGPQIGLWLVQELMSRFGNQAPIVIVSGNVSHDAEAEIKAGIPAERIFLKPVLSAALGRLERLLLELTGSAGSGNTTAEEKPCQPS